MSFDKFDSCMRIKSMSYTLNFIIYYSFFLLEKSDVIIYYIMHWQLRLDYGGGDVTQVFYWLLKKSGFPHQVNLSKKLDAMLLNKLKHEFCHVNLVSIYIMGNFLYTHNHNPQQHHVLFENRKEMCHIEM